jgi:hypothetical protein
MTATYEALDPRSDEPSIERIPLADRPSLLDGLRVALIQTMPPGSGIEPVIDALSAEVAAACPTARPSHYMRKNFMVTDLAELDQLAAEFDIAIAVAGPAGTMVHLAVILATELERRGVPCPVVYFETLQAAAQHSVSTGGAPVRIWPIGNPPFTAEATAAAARTVIADLTSPAQPEEQLASRRHPEPRERIAARGSLAEINETFLANGWTDGLPIVPPTQADVAAMLRGTSRAPDTVVTETFRPEGRRITVEMVAINAVMAGARPDYLPVILATASVFGDIQFESMTRSVNSFAFAQLVNGPISREIGMAGGLNALGPGHRANATIGRTLNLMLRTLGGAQLGINTTPAQGSAVSWAFAFAENEAGSPWQPFHADLGYEANDSVVSILLGGWAHNGNYYYGDLDDVASTLQDFEIPQTGALVMLTEKRAQHLAAEGYTKQGVVEYLHERATIRLSTFRASGFFPMMRNDILGLGPSTAPTWPADYLTRPDDDIVPAYPPGGIRVAVVGADVSATMQAWKLQLHRSVSVDDWR